MLTIAYLTSRKDPKAEWFFASLRRELADDHTGIQVVVVDFYAETQRSEEGWTREDAMQRRAFYHELWPEVDMTVSPPCGNVWQGPHRITRDNFFAKSNGLNTAIMLAKHDWVLIVDDLSCLQPGFMAGVRKSIEENSILCFAYEKRKAMVVKGGVLTSWENHPPGHDHRKLHAPKRADCYSGWFYGCAVCVPVEAILKVNGWPLDADSMGYEDSIMGKTIAKHGYRFVYDPSCLSVESEEHHHIGTQMKRVDPGQSPNDKSHRLLQIYANANRFENYYGEEGLRGVRTRVQSGSPLPIIRNPRHEWFTGTPLEEFGIDLPIINTKT